MSIKQILCVGGLANGRIIADLGSKRSKLSSDPKSYATIIDLDGTEKHVMHVDGYRRVTGTHKGWPVEVMLEDTLREEDLEDHIGDLRPPETDNLYPDEPNYDSIF